MAFRSVRDDAQPTPDGGARAAQPRRDYPSDRSHCVHMTTPMATAACAISLRGRPRRSPDSRVVAGADGTSLGCPVLKMTEPSKIGPVL